MKTFSKIFFGLVLVMALTLVFTSKSMSQQTWCDAHVPYLSMIDHPDAVLPHQEVKMTWQKRGITEFRDLHCGLNLIDSVDPCDPWIAEWYVIFWEDDSDKVMVLDPHINWDTTICQDFRCEYVYPTGYIGNRYYDSVVIKCTMLPHAIDTCVSDPLFADTCEFVGDPIVYLNCWRDCIHERIVYECIDSCEIPNHAMCIIEFDKPLPVELTSFTSAVKDNTVTLFWTTSSENNNARFIIERFNEGLWKDVGNVAGNGTTTSVNNYSFVDINLNSGIYNYRLKQVDYNGNFEYFNLNNAVSIGVPGEFSLSQNYPNPFNPTTTILYGVPNDGYVTMKVYDNNGRELKTIVNEPKTAGYYTVEFNASGLSSGVYFYKLESGNNVVTKKMVLMK